MNNHWWRAYDGAVDHAKLCLLSDRTHRAWFNLMCLASANEGRLPDMKVMALKLRLPAAKVVAIIDELKSARLFDEDETGIRPHNWETRQYKSDVSTERVKRFRNAKRNVSCNDQSTETDNRKKEDTADAVPPKIVFESGVIRLNQKDFEQWRQSFSNLDLRAELLSLTEWAGTQQKWFFAVSSALAKRNREVGIKLKMPPQSAPHRPLTPDGQPWPDGII